MSNSVFKSWLCNIPAIALGVLAIAWAKKLVLDVGALCPAVPMLLDVGELCPAVPMLLDVGARPAVPMLLDVGALFPMKGLKLGVGATIFSGIMVLGTGSGMPRSSLQLLGGLGITDFPLTDLL